MSGSNSNDVQRRVSAASSHLPPQYSLDTHRDATAPGGYVYIIRTATGEVIYEGSDIERVEEVVLDLRP